MKARSKRKNIDDSSKISLSGSVEDVAKVKDIAAEEEDTSTVDELSAPETKQPAPKKRRNPNPFTESKDPSWNPRQEPGLRKPNSHADIFTMLADSAETATNAEGKPTPVKTAVIVKRDPAATPLSPRTERGEKRSLSKAFDEIATNSAIPDPEQYSVLNTPPSTIKIGKREFGKDGEIGELRFYRYPKARRNILFGQEGAPVAPIADHESDTPQSDTPQVEPAKKVNLKTFKKPRAKIKRARFTVDPTSLKKTRRANAFINRSQAKTVVAPGHNQQDATAANYAAAIGEPTHILKLDGTIDKRKFNWCHMILFDASGEQGQRADWLFAATDNMNIWMMPGEKLVTYLAKKFGKVEIHAEVPLRMVDGQPTHFAEGKIKWRLKAQNGFEAILDVDTKYANTQPHRVYQDYVFAYMKKQVERWEKNHGATQQPAAAPEQPAPRAQRHRFLQPAAAPETEKRELRPRLKSK